LAEVVGADGKHRHELRVFCDAQLHSVPLDVCRSCRACAEITGDEADGTGCVRCTPASELVPAGPTPSGRAVRRGVVAVDEGVLVRDVVALFVERGLRMIVVTDAAGRAGGVVHESQLVRQIQDHAHAVRHATHLGWESTTLEPASAIMSPPAMVREEVSLDAALSVMATSHQRQLLVVDEEGFAIGVLVDVDALHALYGHSD
jgi:predicted transcriptional regulator